LESLQVSFRKRSGFVRRNAVRVCFGDCVADFDARELLLAGKPVHVEPRALRLLELLIAARRWDAAEAEGRSERPQADITATRKKTRRTVDELRPTDPRITATKNRKPGRLRWAPLGFAPSQFGPKPNEL
jgi:hypothetical protein